MKKIRINELARELEVKPGVILDLLPELGVQEKKTHSSSVDEDVAIELGNAWLGPANAFRISERHRDDHEAATKLPTNSHLSPPKPVIPPLRKQK